MKVCIIGHAAEKFTPETEDRARIVIRNILASVENATLVSGRSPMGGIDVWAEEEALRAGLPKPHIHPPAVNRWSAPGGFKERNLAMARDGDVFHVVVVRELPRGFRGMRFDGCYHCREARPVHVKSGACWTARQAMALGKPASWHIL